MGDERYIAFVSYSHSDAAIVGPVVKLLRVHNPNIFRDTDSIRPGWRWRDELESAISRSSMLILFWCKHSRESAEVEAEWKLALDRDKALLPILLDDTPLTDELAAYQWIDFRDLVAAGHRELDAGNRLPSPARGPTALMYWLTGAGAAVAMIAVFLSRPLTLDRPAPSGSIDLPSSSTGAPPDHPVNEGFEGTGVAVWLALVVVFIGFALLWRKSRRSQGYVDRPPNSATVRQMVEEIEAEVTRRAS